MPRRQKRDEADNLDKRAVELSDRDDCDAIWRALRVEAWAIRHVMNKMRNMDIKVDEYRGKEGLQKLKEHEGEQTKRLGSAITQGQNKRLKCLKDKAEEEADAVVDSEGKAVPKSLQIPTKYWFVQDITATYFSEKVLPHLEATSLSTANLKATLLKRGQAEYAHKIMVEIFEMATGLVGGESISGSKRILALWLTEIARRSSVRGNRCMTLRLPPCWKTNGIYEISFMKEEVCVLHRWTKKKVLIHREPGMPKYSNQNELYVAFNFSETLASVKSRADLEENGLLLQPFFPTQLLNQTPAITDV